jgi:hypothetical protein
MVVRVWENQNQVRLTRYKTRACSTSMLAVSISPAPMRHSLVIAENRLTHSCFEAFMSFWQSSSPSDSMAVRKMDESNASVSFGSSSGLQLAASSTTRCIVCTWRRLVIGLTLSMYICQSWKICTVCGHLRSDGIRVDPWSNRMDSTLRDKLGFVAGSSTTDSNISCGTLPGGETRSPSRDVKPEEMCAFVFGVSSLGRGLTLVDLRSPLLRLMPGVFLFVRLQSASAFRHAAHGT